MNSSNFAIKSKAFTVFQKCTKKLAVTASMVSDIKYVSVSSMTVDASNIKNAVVEIKNRIKLIE